MPLTVSFRVALLEPIPDITYADLSVHGCASSYVQLFKRSCSCILVHVNEKSLKIIWACKYMHMRLHLCAV